MRNDKIIPGVVLIMIGAMFLLSNYGYISFHLMNLIYLLPVLIVIAGINLIFGHNRTSPWAVATKLAVVVAGFLLVIYGNFAKTHNVWDNDYSYTFDNDDDNDNDTTGVNIVKVSGNSVFNEPFTTDTKVARLNISGGGTVYNLSDTTTQLFNASTKEFHGRYEFKKTKEDSVYTLDFKMKSHHGVHMGWNKSDKTNSATFKLNPTPEWEINVKTGAAKLDFDLTKFKIRSLKLDGGAATFSVRLGQPLTITNVIVNAGMAETTINIPVTAACRITSDTGLASTHYEGFTETKDHKYETPGFDAATNKIYIKMSGGMADFKVKRY
jgi:Ca2+/Na+ antiporter